MQLIAQAIAEPAGTENGRAPSCPGCSVAKPAMLTTCAYYDGAKPAP